jgi:hypothetical protein
LPVAFEKNAGQIDQQVKFFSQSGGQAFYLTTNEAVLVLSNRLESKRSANEVLRMKLQGANPHPRVTGIDELPGRSNYFIGDDPAKWRTDIPSYARVKYESVYPGVDVVYYSKEQAIEYDFVVAPGAGHQQIRLNFNGARALRIDRNDDLIVAMKHGEVRHLKPFIYQEIDGQKIEVAGRYLLLGKRQIGFEIGAYDKSRTLVIDPVISFSTFLGGNHEDWGRGIAVDASGNSYVTGYTLSGDFPVTHNNAATQQNAFVVKLNPSGSAYVYKTHFGGSNTDKAYDIAVDSTGSAYVVGETPSTDFPRVNALQNSLQGLGDGFITKLNAAGNGMVFSTYFGGNSAELISGVTVDSAGSAYFVGSGSSTNLPVLNAFQSANGGSQDTFIGKLTAAGNALVYLSYIGGSAGEFWPHVAVDTSGNAYIAGQTSSTNFPTVNPLQPSNAGGSDAFVAKVNSSGNALIYSTYLGGSSNETSGGVAIDDSGNVYVAGGTRSTNFPLRNPAQATLGGNIDAFVTKLNTDASDFVYSTYLGGATTIHTSCGCESEHANDIAVHNGAAYIIGTTDTTDFPQVNPLQPGFGAGGWDAFTAKYDVNGNVVYASYIGGSGPASFGIGDDQGFGIAVDTNGDSYLAGATGALDFPIINAVQPSHGSQTADAYDAFAMKILDIPGLTITGQILDAGSNPIAGVTVSLSGTRTMTATTNALGSYSFSGLGSGYNCTVTPTKNLYTFDPTSQTFNNLSANQTANFIGTGSNTYTISGRVSKSDGTGVSGVTISLSGSQSRTALTDNAGDYAFSLLVQGDSFTVTPSLPPTYTITNTFTPGFYTFNSIAGNQTANFNLTVTTNVAMHPIADAYVEDGTNAASNFGSVTPLLLKTANQTGQRRDVYFKYDLSTVSRQITNAKLRIWAALSAAGSVNTSAYGVTETEWGESTINWNNKPVRNGTAISGATVAVTSTSFTSYELDLTSYILAEQSAGRKVISLALHNPSNSTPHILLNAREAATNKPQLLLTTVDNNNTAPAVSLLTPANGASYTGPASVALSASASDSDGSISKVDYYAGTNLIGTATTTPYNVTWSSVGVGSYTLTVVATDNQGLTNVSSAVQITVNNGNVPPVVELTAPLSNATFAAGSNLTVSATASDVDGSVTQVEFFNGATLLGIDTTVPYSVSWNNVPAGVHSLTARATDSSGGITTSAAVNIAVVWQTGFSALADAYVKDGTTASTNFGTVADLQVQQGASGANRESYLKFDLASLTGTNTIAQARLQVFGRLNDTSGADVGVGAYSVADTTWVESGSGAITWNTKKPTSSAALATTTVTDNVGRWYEFDVSSYVQGERNAGRSVVSLALKSQAASSPFIIFNSREASGNRPQLMVWTTQTRNALFAVGSANLNAGDADVKTQLEGLGFTVTVKVANNQMTAADASGKALVVVSSTCNANSVTSKFRHVVVPVVNWEFDVLDDFGMTGTTAGTDFGTSTSGQTEVSITSAGHALAAGLSGTVPVVTSGSTFTWGGPNANAAKIATLTSDANKAVIFVYESGATMPGLDAPARRVALFMTDLTADVFNANGNALFNAAIRWATEVNTAPTITLLTPAAGPVGTVVTVSGLNFGLTQGTSTVSFNSVAASVTNWSQKTIVVAVPLYATTGLVVVKVNGVSSNGVTFTVAEVDSDADGLPDWWELQHFGNLMQTASGDPDSDGLSNLQEYQQGRNPTVHALVDDAAINLKLFRPLASPIP